MKPMCPHCPRSLNTPLSTGPIGNPESALLPAGSSDSCHPNCMVQGLLWLLWFCIEAAHRPLFAIASGVGEGKEVLLRLQLGKTGEKQPGDPWELLNPDTSTSASVASISFTVCFLLPLPRLCQIFLGLVKCLFFISFSLPHFIALSLDNLGMFPGGESARLKGAKDVGGCVCVCACMWNNF